MHLPVSLMHCIVIKDNNFYHHKLLLHCTISSNLGWWWKISEMKWFYLLPQFSPGRGFERHRLWEDGSGLDWLKPKVLHEMTHLTLNGCECCQLRFSPHKYCGEKISSRGGSTNHPELLSQSNGPYGTSAEQKMHRDGTFRSRDLFYLLYSPHLYSLLCCFLHRFHSWRSETMSEMLYCSCAGNRRAVCAVWSNAWKLPSLCVPFSVGQMLHRVNCRSPHICQHRRWHLPDRCHTWRMWAPEGWSATRDLQPVTHGKV